MQWDPTEVNDEYQEFVPHRRVGRPLLRWTDPIEMSERQNPYDECQSNPYAHVVVHRNVISPYVPFFHPSADTWW